MVEPPETKAPLIECVGGPLDGKRVPNRGPTVEVASETGHRYKLGLIGDLDDLRNPRRVVYLYEYPEGHGW